jgi:hypothetical protein
MSAVEKGALTGGEERSFDRINRINRMARENGSIFLAL